MRKLPDAIFIIDLKKEALAVREARRLNIPVVALVDTNCDPDEVDYVIPGNDDAIRSCGSIARVIADAIADGKQKIAVEEFKQRRPPPTTRLRRGSKPRSRPPRPRSSQAAATWCTRRPRRRRAQRV